MRRRRTNRSTWFPTLGTQIGEGAQPVTPIIYFDGATIGEQIGDASAQPLVNDVTFNSPPGNSSLRDQVEGQTWRCDRVVGNIFCGWRPLGEETVTQDLICCAALVVLPVDDETQSPELTNEEYQPLGANQSAQPWLWRRTWWLGGPDSETPSTNTVYGANTTGPFCDTKGTKRLIGREQRLFIVTQCMIADGGENVNGIAVNWKIDLRVLGQMVRKRNVSTFK